jgi:hypothetical protein
MNFEGLAGLTASAARYGDSRNSPVAQFWLKQNMPPDLELRRASFMLNHSESQRR